MKNKKNQYIKVESRKKSKEMNREIMEMKCEWSEVGREFTK